MRLKLLTELFSLRDLRNAVLGVVVILGGLGLSGLTLYAHQTGNIRLAGIAAGVSLVFVLLILIFVVPPLARNAGREASQMNLPFEFTTGGAIMLVLLVVVGFSAWNTGNNLLFLVFSLLVAATVVGFLAGSISLKKLDITMRFPETIFAEQPTPIIVTLHNRKRVFPALSTVIEVRGRERERSVAAVELDAILPKWLSNRLGRAPIVRRTLNHFPYVAAGATEEASTDHVFPRRGRLLIKDFELSTKFPFGFFRHRRRLPAREAELLVFPKIVDVDAAADQPMLESGKRTSGLRGIGHDLLALRDYQPHDDPRRIDWKATAWARQLTVREFAADDEKRITILFDTRIPESDTKPPLRERLAAEQADGGTIASERFELGASLVASLLERFAAEGAEIRLVIDADIGESGSGRDHLNEALRRLSCLEPTFERVDEPDTHLERILIEPSDSHRFLVTTANTAGAELDDRARLNIVRF